MTHDMTTDDWEALWQTQREAPVADLLPGLSPIDDAPGAAETPQVLNIERLGATVIDDDGTVSSIRALIGGQVRRLCEWVYLTLDGEFFNVRTGEQITKSAFDTAMAVHTPAIEFAHDDDRKARKYPASKTLLEFLRGPSVYSVMYRPDIDARFFKHEGKEWVNSYLPHSVPDADHSWQGHEAVAVVRDHIRNILPDGADTIIQWMAHNVQMPGRKIRWAVVIVGVEGDGKTSLGEVLKAAMGPHVADVSSDELKSDFSEWAQGKAVRVMEEIKIDGERRATVMDKLKPKITNAEVRIVPKGKSGRSVVNVTNYIALTNHIDALPVTDGDRRWAVWKTRYPDRAAMLAEMSRQDRQAFWDRFYDLINRHREVIRGWLMSIDLRGFSINQPPETTAAKRMMMEASRTAADFAVQEAIEIGGFGVASDVLVTDCLVQRIRDMGDVPPRSSALNKMLTDAKWTKHEGQLWWRDKARRIYYRAEAFAGLPDARLKEALRTRLDDTTVQGEPHPYAGDF